MSKTMPVIHSHPEILGGDAKDAASSHVFLSLKSLPSLVSSQCPLPVGKIFPSPTVLSC
jgi:hypothetical protein